MSVTVIPGYTEAWVVIDLGNRWAKGYDYFEITGTGGISKKWVDSDQNYYTSITLTGLTPGTTYTIYVWGSWSGTIEYIGQATFTTAIPTPNVPSAPLIDTSRDVDGRFEYNGTAGLALKWGAVSDATSYRVKFRRGYDGYETVATVSTNTPRIYNLNFGTTYFISVSAGNNYGWSDYSSENQGTTAPQTPVIYASNKTNTSVRINLSSMSGDWTRVEIYRYNSSGTLLGTATITKTGNQYVDYSLTSGTYKFRARAFLVIGSTTIKSVYESNEIELTFSPRPQNWEWTSTELNAFNNKGAVSTLIYTRWNNFIDKIIEFRNYKGLSTNVIVNGTSYSISMAKMTANDKVLTALRFNIARQAIGEMYATGISTKYPGDPVYGWYFITMANSLNNVN